MKKSSNPFTEMVMGEGVKPDDFMREVMEYSGSQEVIIGDNNDEYALSGSNEEVDPSLIKDSSKDEAQLIFEASMMRLREGIEVIISVCDNDHLNAHLKMLKIKGVCRHYNKMLDLLEKTFSFDDNEVGANDNA
jgi:hypothetical protein